MIVCNRFFFLVFSLLSIFYFIAFVVFRSDISAGKLKQPICIAVFSCTIFVIMCRPYIISYIIILSCFINIGCIHNFD